MLLYYLLSRRRRRRRKGGRGGGREEGRGRREKRKVNASGGLITCYRDIKPSPGAFRTKHIAGVCSTEHFIRVGWQPCSLYDGISWPICCGYQRYLGDVAQHGHQSGNGPRFQSVQPCRGADDCGVTQTNTEWSAELGGRHQAVSSVWV
jgi:hypothetical protein